MIGFAGLTHLGINYSLATAAKGFDVVAFHPSAESVERFRRGEFSIEEPGLPELFAEHRQRLRYTADARDLAACELVFVSLDVKTDDANRSDTGPLRELLRTIVPCLAPGTTVVLLSQVNPGFTRSWRAELESAGASVQVFYQVETLVFGRAVERALQPERFMVGAAEPEKPLPARLSQWHQSFGCPVLTMRYESAELAKIAINFFLVSSVATSNTLAEVCGRIGADWTEIVPALRLDARIGPKAYLNPGLGIAGGNLERDLVTVKRLNEGGDGDTGIIDAWLANSRHCRDWTDRTLQQAFAERRLSLTGVTLAIWGLAYKENTHSTKNSPSLAFIARHSACLKRAYDPGVELPEGSFPNFEQPGSALACCDAADALIIPTPWPEFRHLSLLAVRAAMRGRIILDPFGMLNGREAQELGFDYHRLGTPALTALGR